MNDDAQKVTSLNVLVVDDDSTIRKTLSYCLAAEGYTVIAVSNSADALDEVKEGEGSQTPVARTSSP